MFHKKRAAIWQPFFMDRFHVLNALRLLLPEGDLPLL